MIDPVDFIRDHLMKTNPGKSLLADLMKQRTPGRRVVFIRSRRGVYYREAILKKYIKERLDERLSTTRAL